MMNRMNVDHTLSKISRLNNVTHRLQLLHYYAIYINTVYLSIVNNSSFPSCKHGIVRNILEKTEIMFRI
jgi:hypothetical protein